jgi:rare lipoprotein A (peptidoglycan hydrolase)
VQARVVDRGPFVAGREFDLTSATAQKLHFAALGTIQVSQG